MPLTDDDGEVTKGKDRSRAGGDKSPPVGLFYRKGEERVEGRKALLLADGRREAEIRWKPGQEETQENPPRLKVEEGVGVGVGRKRSLAINLSPFSSEGKEGHTNAILNTRSGSIIPTQLLSITKNFEDKKSKTVKVRDSHILFSHCYKPQIES